MMTLNHSSLLWESLALCHNAPALKAQSNRYVDLRPRRGASCISGCVPPMAASRWFERTNEIFEGLPEHGRLINAGSATSSSKADMD
jgi:hypothetical protein